jgi:membrane-bound ClpP family serine protease
MEIALIAFVLLLGIVLIFLEIFVIPGTTIFGIMGTIASIAAIYFAYKLLGINYGNLTVVVGFIVFLIFLYAGKKLVKDNQMSLKTELKGKVNEFVANVQVGDIGKTFSDVKPNGKAFFGEDKLEVFSNGSYIDRDIDVKIIKIEQNKIFIKPLN